MDIKIRERSGDMIKTMDRAALMTGRFKDISIKTKDELAGSSDRDKGSYEYASEVIRGSTRAGSVYALRAGRELILRSKRAGVYHPSENNETIHQDDVDMPRISPEESTNTLPAQPYSAAQSMDMPRYSTGRVHIADAEVTRYAEEYRAGRRINRSGRTARKAESTQQYLTESAADRFLSPQIANNRYEPPKTADIIQQRKKEYAIKRLRKSGNVTGESIRTGAISIGNRSGKAADSIGRMVRGMTEGAGAMPRPLFAGAAAVFLIIVIMMIFGASLNMTEDGYYIDGVGDADIVEVARSQLGNKGGEKFWKWYGFSSHVDWCAIFCSWCADQCGYLDAGLLPKFSVVGDGASWFRSHHRWAGSGYTPHPGDMIFFDFENDGVTDHVGIVETCDGKSITTIEGNCDDACRRVSYRAGDQRIAGYGLSVTVSVHASSAIFERAIVWANHIADDSSYHYVRWKSGDGKTQECPICNDHPKGKYRGWNCIGFAFACWKHGAGINCRCSCGVIDNGTWDRLLACDSAEKADRIAADKVGVPCKVIRNDGRAIPLSMLQPGDILCMYNGGTSFHVIFYEGNGKYADCNSGNGDNIRSGQSMSKGARSVIKLAIRYTG